MPQTSKSTNNSIVDDVHDQLIKAFMEYSKHNARFELFGYQTSAVAARSALSQIGKLAKDRRNEIWDKRIALHGHLRKGIEPTAPDERRKRKLAKKQAKIQAQELKSKTNE